MMTVVEMQCPPVLECFENPRSAATPAFRVKLTLETSAFVEPRGDTSQSSYVTRIVINDSASVRVTSSNSERSNFLDSVYALDAHQGSRSAMDYIIDRLDDALSTGDLDDCDYILLAAEPSRLSDALIVAFLGITLAAKNKLVLSRAVFYRRAWGVVQTRRGTEGADKLLKKYS